MRIAQFLTTIAALLFGGCSPPVVPSTPPSGNVVRLTVTTSDFILDTRTLAELARSLAELMAAPDAPPDDSNLGARTDQVRVTTQVELTTALRALPADSYLIISTFQRSSEPNADDTISIKLTEAREAAQDAGIPYSYSEHDIGNEEFDDP